MKPLTPYQRRELVNFMAEMPRMFPEHAHNLCTGRFEFPVSWDDMHEAAKRAGYKFAEPPSGMIPIEEDIQTLVEVVDLLVEKTKLKLPDRAAEAMTRAKERNQQGATDE
jgi:hypothetical protein